MPITRIDPRSTALTSFGDVGGALAWLADQADLNWAAIESGISVLNVNLGPIALDAEAAKDTAVQIRTRLGDPGGSTNIDAKINTLITNVGDAGDDCDELIDAVGHRTEGQIDLLGATQNIIDGKSVYMQAKEAAEQTRTGGTALGEVIGEIVSNVFGGGSDLITIGKWLQSIWDAPPVDVLTASSLVSLSPTQTLAIPSGVYGYKLEFSVPGYWGQLSLDPVVYQPHIAVAAWRGPFGTVGPVALLSTPTSQVYPRPAGATLLDIQLRPGITGYYRELRFLGL